MNSDTSQEILRYQKEWAKQFHEQMGKASIAAMGYNPPNNNEKEIVSGTGVPGAGSALTGGDSSQMML